MPRGRASCHRSPSPLARGAAVLSVGLALLSGMGLAGAMPASAHARKADIPFARAAHSVRDNAQPTRIAHAVSRCLDGGCSWHVLGGVDWQREITDTWCGPASTRIALSVLSWRTRIRVPSQAQLAAFLGTTKAGTKSIDRVVAALNYYGATRWYEAKRIPGDDATPAQRELLREDIEFDVLHGYALVANVWSGWRPAGYPDGPIEHYVAVVGYGDSGSSAIIADPASGLRGFERVPETYVISTSSLATWIAGSTGYAA